MGTELQNLNEKSITGKKTVFIQRCNSIGDVICASFVATRMKQLGLAEKIIFAAYAGVCSDILRHHPDIDHLIVPGIIPADIVLDGYYETHLGFPTDHLIHLFLEAAGITDMSNIIPRIGLIPDELCEAAKVLEPYPRPWLFLGLRSKCATERTVPDRVWAKVIDKLSGFGGTMFSCGGPDEIPMDGTVNLVNKLTLRIYAAAVSMADMVATVDSSHLHIAQSFKRPMVALGMAVNPALRLSPLVDYSVVSSDVPCIYCSGGCRYAPHTPPCRNIDPQIISEAIWKKLRAQTGNSVSALIPLYKPDFARLAHCLESIKSQVDEIVVGLDGCDEYAEPILPPGCIVVRSNKRLGYAKIMNEMARNSGGRHLLMLNDDAFLDDGAVSKMMSAMDEKTAVVGCCLRYLDGRIQHGGMYWSPRVKAFDHIDRFAKSAGIKHRCELDAVTFAAVLVNRKVFFDLLCFDERYDCYWEDVDFCTKASQSGWKVVYEPEATGVHLDSSTTLLLGEQRERMWCKGSALYWSKWGNIRGINEH